jgi:hypothetical protein
MDDRQVPKDLAKLYTDFAILKTAMIGIDGKNGLKGDFEKYASRTEEKIRNINHIIGNLVQKFDAFIDESREQRLQISQEIQENGNKLSQYIQVDRPKTCYGLAEIQRRDVICQAQQDQQAQDNKQKSRDAKLGRYTIIGAIITATVAILTFIGSR